MGALDGLRVVEGSAFVAAPLGGMTLAQLGADVIRFDNIGGGIDFHRWPETPDGHSLFWAGMNKGKRSLAVDVRSPEGQELVTALITAPGPDCGVFLSNFPAERLAQRRAPAGAPRRPDLRQHPRQPRRRDGGRLHGQPGVRLRLRHRAARRQPADEPRAAGVGHRHRPHRRGRAARRRAGAHPHRRRPVRVRVARRRRLHDGRQPRLPRPGPGARRGPPADRQRHVRRVRPRLPHRRRPPGDGRGDQPAPVAVAGRGRSRSASTCRRSSGRSGSTSPRRATASGPATRSPP